MQSITLNSCLTKLIHGDRQVITGLQRLFRSSPGTWYSLTPVFCNIWRGRGVWQRRSILLSRPFHMIDSRNELRYSSLLVVLHHVESCMAITVFLYGFIQAVMDLRLLIPESFYYVLKIVDSFRLSSIAVTLASWSLNCCSSRLFRLSLNSFNSCCIDLTQSGSSRSGRQSIGDFLVSLPWQSSMIQSWPSAL